MSFPVTSLPSLNKYEKPTSSSQNIKPLAQQTPLGPVQNPQAFGKKSDFATSISDTGSVLRAGFKKPVSPENAQYMSGFMTDTIKAQKLEVQGGKSASASVSSRSISDDGTVSTKAKASGSVSATGKATASISEDGVKGCATVGVCGKVNAKASGSASVAGVDLSGNVNSSASAGATARAKGHVDSNGAGGSIGGFAGAKAEVGAGGSIAGVKANAKGSVIAGVAAKAEGDVSLKNGNLSVSFGAEAALGIGLGFNVSFNINLNPIKNLFS
jgi:hypothetical protein